MKHRYGITSALLLGISALLAGAAPAWAQVVPPPLGSAANFAALGGTGVTCTNPNPPLPAVTISGGNVGSGLPGVSSVTGFPGFTAGATPCSLSGNVLVGQTAAMADFTTAYNALATGSAFTCPRPVSEAGHNLAGNLLSGSQGAVLEPGVYCISGVGTLTGQLTLAGPSTGVWIFKAASSLTPIGGSIVMANGGLAANVYWQLGTAAAFDSNSDFVGTVLAGSAITFTGVGSSLCGRALAQTNVTLTGANIAVGTCGGTQSPPPPPTTCDKDNGHKKDGEHHGQDRQQNNASHGKQKCDDDHDDDDRNHGHDNDDDNDHDKDHDKGDRDTPTPFGPRKHK